MEDEILRQIADARKRLMAKHGSFKAYVKHLRALDREQAAKLEANAGRSSRRSGRKKPDSDHKDLDGEHKRSSSIKAQRSRFDPIVDPIRNVREKLLREHGGFEKFFKYLQKLDREYFAKNRPKKRKSKTNQTKAPASSGSRRRRSA